MSQSGFTRRYFFYGSLLAGAVRSVPSLKALGYKSPNEKLNIAGIGAGGQPFSDLTDSEAGVENVVALTDVDWLRGQQGFAKWPKAEKYKDFRQMLDKSGKDIDAVVIGTADHMHATCALACMQAGKHVYVEKPLTRTAWEARLLAQAAEKGEFETWSGVSGSAVEPAIAALMEASEAARVRVTELIGAGNYVASLETIARLRPLVDRFFDEVMVMDPNPIVRRGNLVLLLAIVDDIQRIADLSEIVTAG